MYIGNYSQLLILITNGSNPIKLKYYMQVVIIHTIFFAFLSLDYATFLMHDCYYAVYIASIKLQVYPYILNHMHIYSICKLLK